MPRPVSFECPVCHERWTIGYADRAKTLDCPQCHCPVQLARHQILWAEAREYFRHWRETRRGVAEERARAAKAERERLAEERRQAAETERQRPAEEGRHGPRPEELHSAEERTQSVGKSLASGSPRKRKNFLGRYKDWCGIRSFIFQCILLGWTALWFFLGLGMALVFGPHPESTPEGLQTSVTVWLCSGCCCPLGIWLALALPLAVIAIATLGPHKTDSYAER